MFKTIFGANLVRRHKNLGLLGKEADGAPFCLEQLWLTLLKPIDVFLPPNVSTLQPRKYRGPGVWLITTHTMPSLTTTFSAIPE